MKSVIEFLEDTIASIYGLGAILVGGVWAYQTDRPFWIAVFISGWLAMIFQELWRIRTLEFFEDYEESERERERLEAEQAAAAATPPPTPSTAPTAAGS